MYVSIYTYSHEHNNITIGSEFQQTFIFPYYLQQVVRSKWLHASSIYLQRLKRMVFLGFISV